MELDEGCRPRQFSLGSGHPAIHVLPSALAFAQAQGSAGPEFMAALVAGYEVHARITRSSRLRYPVHSHGHIGNPAAGAALGKLSGWNAEQIRQGINVATGLATATSWQSCLVGATVRNSFPGLAAQSAFTTKMLVESGFTGYDAALGETFGEILGDDFDPNALVEGLGEHFYVLDNYFKFHAACGTTHPVLDAMADALGGALRRGEYPPMPAMVRPDPTQVRRILVRVPERSLRLAVGAQANQLSAKFSIPYAAATYVVRGSSEPDSFAGDSLNDPRVWELARRVEVLGDPTLTTRHPHDSPAEVEIELEGGQVLRGSCSNPFGSAPNPASLLDLNAKFRSITDQVLDASRQEALWATVLSLENEADLGRFPHSGE